MKERNRLEFATPLFLLYGRPIEMFSCCRSKRTLKSLLEIHLANAGVSRDPGNILKRHDSQIYWQAHSNKKSKIRYNQGLFVLSFFPLPYSLKLVSATSQHGFWKSEEDCMPSGNMLALGSVWFIFKIVLPPPETVGILLEWLFKNIKPCTNPVTWMEWDAGRPSKAEREIKYWMC